MSEVETKSPRHQLADRIASFCNEHPSKLGALYGGDVHLSKTGRPHYSVGFCAPRFLDGVIKVYSHNFIVVQYQCGYRALPHDDSRVFETEENVLKFLKLAFVDFNFDEAMKVPVKEKK